MAAIGGILFKAIYISTYSITMHMLIIFIGQPAVNSEYGARGSRVIAIMVIAWGRMCQRHATSLSIWR
jgi:hypothetical protein